VILELDHLVIAARSLAQGLAWCEDTLGATPIAGGQHVFMGTHNRIFSVASTKYARAYLELIAIDTSLPSPARPRWFELDSAEMQSALDDGPRLVHWVARCDDMVAARQQMQAGGIDVGAIEHVQRQTPQGALHWQISLRGDGTRALRGAAPALIKWVDVHPSDTLGSSEVALESVSVGGWPEVLASMLCPNIDQDNSPDSPPIRARLSTPYGFVTLQSIR
jgi:hypothetical protein